MGRGWPGCPEETGGARAEERTHSCKSLERQTSLQASRLWGGINETGLPGGSGPCVGPDESRETVGLLGWRGTGPSAGGHQGRAATELSWLGGSGPVSEGPGSGSSGSLGTREGS